MNLQKCDNCNAQFKWSEIYNSLFVGYRPIQCSQCGTKHKIASSTLLVSFLLVFPWLIFNLFLSNFTVFFRIVIDIIIVVFISLILPFFVKYTSD